MDHRIVRHTLLKNKGKLRKDRVQSHIWGTSSYIRLNIRGYSHIRKNVPMHCQHIWKPLTNNWTTTPRNGFRNVSFIFECNLRHCPRHSHKAFHASGSIVKKDLSKEMPQIFRACKITKLLQYVFYTVYPFRQKFFILFHRFPGLYSVTLTWFFLYIEKIYQFLLSLTVVT